MSTIADFFTAREFRKIAELETRAPKGEAFNSEIHSLPLPRLSTSMVNRDPTTMKYANEAYLRNSIVGACISIRASEMKTAPIKVYDIKTNKEEPNCALAELLYRPNPILDQAGFLQYLETYLCVGGNAYVHKVRNGYGALTQLYPYHASQMIPIIGDRSWITKYRYDSWDGYIQDIDANDIAHYRWDIVDFNRPWLGGSPILTIAKEIDIDDESAQIEIATLQNGMVIPFAIIPGAPQHAQEVKLMTDQQITTQLERLKSKYGGKNRGSGILLNFGSDIKPLGVSPKDFGSLTSRQISETRIPSVLKIPLSKTQFLASLKNATFNNRESDELTFANTMVAHMNSIAATFNHSIKNEVFADGKKGSDYYIAFDISKIQALQERNEKKRQRVREEYTANLITENEARAELGMEPAANGNGDQYFYQKVAVNFNQPTATI